MQKRPVTLPQRPVSLAKCATAPPPAPAAPAFTLRETASGKLEVVWTKGKFDGVKLH